MLALDTQQYLPSKPGGDSGFSFNKAAGGMDIKNLLNQLEDAMDLIKVYRQQEHSLIKELEVKENTNRSMFIQMSKHRGALKDENDRLLQQMERKEVEFKKCQHDADRLRHQLFEARRDLACTKHELNQIRHQQHQSELGVIAHSPERDAIDSNVLDQNTQPRKRTRSDTVALPLEPLTSKPQIATGAEASHSYTEHTTSDSVHHVDYKKPCTAQKTSTCHQRPTDSGVCATGNDENNHLAGRNTDTAFEDEPIIRPDDHALNVISDTASVAACKKDIIELDETTVVEGYGGGDAVEMVGITMEVPPEFRSGNDEEMDIVVDVWDECLWEPVYAGGRGWS